MLQAVNEGLLFVIEIIRRSVNNLISTANVNTRSVLLYGIAIGIAVSLVFMSVKLIRKSTWGH